MVYSWGAWVAIAPYDINEASAWQRPLSHALSIVIILADIIGC